MQQEPQDRTVQLNLATEQRNAARDYHEHVAPGSVELMLATWDMDKLDHQAQANPYMFKLRFGFDATTEVRAQVMRFQKRYDVSDREVRWLKQSGYIRTTRTDMRVDASRTMPILGWTQLVFFTFVIGLMVLPIALSNAPQWQQGLGLLVMGSLWFGVAWMMHRLYIGPWQILKQAGVVGGTSRSNPAAGDKAAL